MITFSRHKLIKWIVASLTLALAVGCSNLNYPVNQSSITGFTTTKQQNGEKVTPSNNTTGGTANSGYKSSAQELGDSNKQVNDPSKMLLANMMQLAHQGKVINCDFPVKTTVFEDIQKVWRQADTTVYIAAAKGRYATYLSRNIVFGINKGEQVFEVRSLAKSQFSSVSLTKVKEVFGPPAYKAKLNGQEIFGYTAGPEFKIEMVFPEPTNDNPNPSMDHYNVLYPGGTVNMMADDPGRQW